MPRPRLHTRVALYAATASSTFHGPDGRQQPMVVVNWCGHGQEFVPWPEADGYCDVGACPASLRQLGCRLRHLGEPRWPWWRKDRLGLRRSENSPIRDVVRRADRLWLTLLTRSQIKLVDGLTVVLHRDSLSRLMGSPLRLDLPPGCKSRPRQWSSERNKVTGRFDNRLHAERESRQVPHRKTADSGIAIS